jgi:hypothetical protein
VCGGKKYDHKRRSTTQLYDEALKNLSRKDELAKKQANIDSECTFTPQLFTRRNTSPAGGLAGGARTPESKKTGGGVGGSGKKSSGKKKASTVPIQTRLYDEKAQERSKLKREQLRQEREVSNCTFTPEILVRVRPSSTGGTGGKNGKGGAGGEGGGGGGGAGASPSKEALFNRLHDNALKQERRLEEKRQEMISKDLEKCTFSPNLTKTTRRSERSPDAPALTGPPKTSRDFPPTSGCFDRLYTNAVQQQVKKDAAEEYLPKDCTFMPKTNKRALREYGEPGRLGGGGMGGEGGAGGGDGVDRIVDLNDKFDRMYREGTEVSG